MQKANRAAVEFGLYYESDHGYHRDRLILDRVDFWRDSFPDGFGRHISRLFPGESCKRDFAAGTLTPHYAQEKIVAFAKKQFLDPLTGRPVQPVVGRFYPQGYAWRALGCFPQNNSPFRIVENSDDHLAGDANHPLSRFPLTAEARLLDRRGGGEEHGGGSTDIAEVITTGGPGMQLPLSDVPTDFYANYPFTRANNTNDNIFYRSPRFVNHLDDTAAGEVRSLHARLLSCGWKILDLMSSWVSHLPASVTDHQTTGLGMNEEEMRANSQLKRHLVHDLNLSPRLPFADNEFDAAICTASIEYLTQPLEVMKEIVRVVRPGGISVTTFSDRWFPGKEIMIWADLHPFERLGLVMDYYLRVNGFDNLCTESVQGLPRPVTDKYFGKTFSSDPIFAVWGTVK